MPVVTARSDLINDQWLQEAAPDPEQAKGHGFTAQGTVVNAATDSQGSKYLLARIPSDCILSDRTSFWVSNWGYADIRIGTKTDPVALVSATKVAAAVQMPIVGGAPAQHCKRLWQNLGLAADPGGLIEIYAHGSVANAVAAGTMLFAIHYWHR